MNQLTMQRGCFFEVTTGKMSLEDMVQKAINFHEYDGLEPSLPFLSDLWTLIIDNEPDLMREFILDSFLKDLTHLRERGRSLQDDSNETVITQHATLGTMLTNSISEEIIEYLDRLVANQQVHFWEKAA